MQKWEYSIGISQRRYTSSIMDGIRAEEWAPIFDLNQMGNDGWELMAVIPIVNFKDLPAGSYGGITNELQYIFKRPLPE